MNRIKTFLVYISWIIILYVLSDFLINVGLNSTYRDIQRLDNIDHVKTHQAEATMVNGRIKGLVTNEGSKNLTNKYIKVQLYTTRNVEIGRKYIHITDLEREESKPFEVYFKMQNIEKYKISLISEKEKIEEDAKPSQIEEITNTEDMSDAKVFIRVAIAMIKGK